MKLECKRIKEIYTQVCTHTQWKIEFNPINENDFPFSMNIVACFAQVFGVKLNHSVVLLMFFYLFLVYLYEARYKSEVHDKVC